MSKRSLVLVLIATLLLAACGGSAEPADPSPVEPSAVAPTEGGAFGAAVTVQLFAFDPDTLEVDTGTTVTWTNEDDIEHTATAEEGAFDGDLDGAGSEFSFTFEKGGTFAYRCDIHDGMRGQIRVT